MNNILTGPIPTGKMLIGRRGFFFDPPTDMNGNQNGNPNPGNQQQQQQQQQQDDFVSPFADVDRDLLDDAQRTAIDRAEQQMRTMHGQIKSVATLQQRADLLQNQLQQLQSQHQQQQPPPQNNNEPPTLEQELQSEYETNGIDPKTAKQLATMNAKIFQKFGQRFEEHIGSRFAPIAGQVLGSGARDAFEQAMQSDGLNRFAIPEVAEAVWQQTQSMAQQGQIPTREFVDNLASIHYVRYLANNPGHVPQSQQQQEQNPNPFQPRNPQPPVNQTTRYTYPGAGANTRPPQPGNNPQPSSRPTDPDTDAAMQATVTNWPVTPKAYKNGSSRFPTVITRGT